MKEHFVRLVKHTGIYGIGFAGSRFGYLLLLPMYTHYLTPTEFGLVALLTVLFTVEKILFNSGLSSALFKSYFEARTQEEKKQCVSTTFLTVLILVSVGFMLTVCLADPLSVLIFDDKDHAGLVILVSLATIFETILLLPQSILRAQERSVLFVISGGLQALFLIIFSFLFMGVLHERIYGVVYAWIAAPLVVGVPLLLYLMKDIALSFSKRVIYRLLSFGLPLLPSNLAIWFLNYSDQYALGKHASLDVVGVYSLGFRISLVVSTLVVMPFTLEWAPFMLDVEKEDNARTVYSRILTYYMFFAVSVALLVSLYADVIVRIFATPSYYSASSMVPLFTLSFVLYGMFWIFSIGPTLTRKTIFISLASCGGAFFAGIGYIWLIPLFKSSGAAFSKIIGYGIMSVMLYFFSRRLYLIHFEWSRILRIVISAAIIYLLSTVAHPDSLWLVIFIKGTLFLVYLIVLYLSGLFSREEIDQVRMVTANAVGRLRYGKRSNPDS